MITATGTLSKAWMNRALGVAFDRAGWTACVAGIGATLAIAALLAVRLRIAATAPSASAAR